MIGRVILSMILLLCLLVVTSCRQILNYQESDQPLFWDDFAGTPPTFEGDIKIVTWNIRFSENIETAIAELRSVEELSDADILLLQEMDEVGVDEIARSLDYNYVYYPASVHTYHNKNFGNAILSKWPISEPAKLLLPFVNPKNSQTRIAVRAVVTVEQRQVLVYSVHTETFWLGPQKKVAQIEALVDDIPDDEPYVIVGGDFNTLTGSSIVEVEEQFASADLTRASEETGETFEATFLPFVTDHIFARGMAVIEASVWAETEASDHFPVRADLTFDAFSP